MIRVISPGFLTSIQDLGRKGFANIGVPISGAMDHYSMKLANNILHNNENEAVLEITFGHCKFVFEKETYICISGADFSAEINKMPIVLNTVIKIFKDDVLSFGRHKFGVRSYISVLGGFQTDVVLNSKSFYQGVTNFSIVKKGDLLPFNAPQDSLEPTYTAVKQNANHFNSKIIDCYKGPEYNLLSHFQKKRLEETIFTIAKANNRMAYQLNETIENNLKSMLTSAVLSGTVQLTPSGQLIVLMRDCQVTGGYPRVLQLENNAINMLSQKTTNDTVKFNVIDLN
ncbi:biotin-dependent carboxyltransferase family protein [uncultured Lacinutrix sp.]|uniref:5-oxoprolinase subunit C family protein n=1 Tax=uncultured Lacinutrix sp. TaxID=574032 RepID=UPI0026151EC4|nr:biotin-dependent carboxyltransferase family protein [uncultured Lacinutrix sp.]